jgi:hypothetical protein
MIRTIVTTTALFLSSSALAQQAPSPAPETQVSETSLRSMVEAMVGVGTRHTLSEQDNPVRGIGAALRWAEAEFRRIGADCGGCLTVQLPEQVIEGNRVPVPTRLVNVLGVQLGTERPNEVVIISGHIDSRVSDVMNATADAPGANDNASGTAAVIEAARVLSRHRFPTTIVYAVLSGEEQGLYGGRLLAAHAAAQGWTVKAQLNNDIIGGSRGSDGVTDNAHVRVFSEGHRADSNEAYRAASRREGGENDSPSRNLSRFIAGLGGPDAGMLNVRQIFRADRFGRGGDQLPMQEAGYPAVRLSVAIEDYDHQHQDLRTENGTVYGDTIDEMDFPYLARVTALNVRALAALARAPMPPAVRAQGAVANDTTLTWSPVEGASGYRIYRRRSDESGWGTAHATISTPLTFETAEGTRLRWVLAGERLDDWMYGVTALTSSGHESPIASAVPGGAFAPLPR